MFIHLGTKNGFLWQLNIFLGLENMEVWGGLDPQGLCKIHMTYSDLEVQLLAC